MAVEVALAMLHQEGRWLMQLRDETPNIVALDCWGLFGGHLDQGETPAPARLQVSCSELMTYVAC